VSIAPASLRTTVAHGFHIVRASIVIASPHAGR
jgi:hypothetical protein